MIVTHATAPYQIDSVAIERVVTNYSLGNCYDCQTPSIPKSFKPASLQIPQKISCSKVTFNLKDHHTVFFDFDKATLRNDERKKLIEWLKGLPKKTNFIVVGYTDKIGSKSYNKVLAEKRAQTVATFIKKLFPQSQIEIRAKGKCCFRSQKNCLNRRVEIIANKKLIYKPKLEVLE